MSNTGSRILAKGIPQLKKFLIIAAAMILLVSVASADSLIVVANLSVPISTDVTDFGINVSSFQPGSNGVPLNATLQSFTVLLSDEIAGDFTLTNTTGATKTSPTGAVDTAGSLHLFLTGNPDIFAGGGPDPTGSNGVSSLGPGEASAMLAYDSGLISGPTATDTNAGDLTSASTGSNWVAYLDTVTNLSSSPSGIQVSLQGSNEITNGSVTVTYNYTTPGPIPEPATLSLLGFAVLGLSIAGKRLTRRG